MTTLRYAVVGGTPQQVSPYLPDNYWVVGSADASLDRPQTVIVGWDVAGWTLTYVLDRLASGMYFGSELVRTDELHQLKERL